MKFKRVNFMLAGGLALGLLAPGAAYAEHEKDSKSKSTTRSTDVVSSRDKHLMDSNFIRASKLLDRPLLERKGDEVAGRLMDIIVDRQDGMLAYAVIRLGGWDFDEATRFAVPISLITETENNKLRLNLTKDQMDRSLSFKKTSWPDMSDRTWAEKIHSHYGVEPYWKQLELPARDESLQRRRNQEQEFGRVPILDQKYPWQNRLSEMMNRIVSSRTSGGDVARIKDFVIDLKHRRLVYAVLANETNTDKVVLAPWNAVETDPIGGKYFLRVSNDDLRAMAFDEKSWPALTDPQFARTLHQKFDADPYWTVYGFGGTAEWDDSWRSGSEYNKLFKADHVKSITGKVSRIDTFRLGKDSARGRSITIKTDDGIEQVVHLGPFDYVERPNIKFHVRPGDEVTVTGSMVKHEGDTVMLASRVKKGDDYLNLRTARGVPTWDRSATDDSEDVEDSLNNRNKRNND